MLKDDLLPLLPEFFNYCQLERNADPDTAQKHLYHIKSFLRKYDEFSDLTGRTVLLELRKTHKASSIKRWLYSMRLLCDFLIYKKLIEENWARKIPEPKVPRLIPHIPTTLEIEQLLAVYSDRTYMHYPDKQYAHKLWNAMYLFLAHTGCRIGEMLNAKCGDFNWDGPDLWLTLNETKTDKGRQVPISKPLCELIVCYLNPSTPNRPLFVHPLTQNAFRHHQVERQFVLRKKKAGINKPYVVHSLRKYFIVELLRADVSVLKVMELVGHENLSTTQGYAKMVRDDLKDAIKRHPMVAGSRTTKEILSELDEILKKRGVKDDSRFEVTTSDGELKIKVKDNT